MYPADEPLLRVKSRQALTQMMVEGVVESPGGKRLSVELWQVYLIVLNATLHGVEISISRVATITSVPRPTIGRRMAALTKLEMVERGSTNGFRVPDVYLRRPEADVWIQRLSGLVMRAAKEIEKERENPGKVFLSPSSV